MGISFGCADQRPNDDTGRFGKADGVTTEESLAALLEADGVFQMPPIGVEHGARELFVDVSVVPAERDTLQSVVEPLLRETAEKLCVDSTEEDSGGIYCLFNMSEVRFSIRHGFQRDDIRDSFIETLAPEHRQAIESLITAPPPNGFAAHYSHYQAYDLGAEIIGDEIFVILPSPFSGSPDAGNAIIVHLEYIDA